MTGSRRLVVPGTIVVSAGILFLALNAAVLVALACHFIVYLRYAISAVNYRYELFEPEGIVWQQAMLIPGPRMYGDITHYPFIVFHYPPVYHLVVRGLAALGADPLAAGRAISLLATLLTGGVVASLTFRATRPEVGRSAGLIGAAVGALTFFCFYPVVMMSPLMRSDMPAIGLSFLGVWCALKGVNRVWPLYAATLLFVLAAFTKQTCVVAPLATMAVLWLVNPGRTTRVCCLGLVLSCAVLAVMESITSGGFLRHLVLYNINRFSLRLMADQIIKQSPQFIFVGLALVSLVCVWRRLSRRGNWTSFASFRADLAARGDVRIIAIVTVYLGLSTCSLITLGKSGGGLNYFVEWMAVLSVLIGALSAFLVRRELAAGWRGAGRGTILAGCLVPVLILLQMRILPASWDFGAADAVRTRQLDDLVVRIRDARKPVLSEDMVLLMRAGKEVPWEPAIFTELADTGRWDERLIIDLIRSHAFAFVITRENDDRYTAGVRDAIRTAYPRAEKYAGRTVRQPPATENQGQEPPFPSERDGQPLR